VSDDQAQDPVTGRRIAAPALCRRSTSRRARSARC